MFAPSPSRELHRVFIDICVLGTHCLLLRSFTCLSSSLSHCCCWFTCNKLVVIVGVAFVYRFNVKIAAVRIRLQSDICIFTYSKAAIIMCIPNVRLYKKAGCLQKRQRSVLQLTLFGLLDTVTAKVTTRLTHLLKITPRTIQTNSYLRLATVSLHRQTNSPTKTPFFVALHRFGPTWIYAEQNLN